MNAWRSERDWARAMRHFSEHNFQAAKAVCETLLLDDPRHAQSHWMLSSIAAHYGRPREASEHALLAGAALRSETANAWLNISWMLITLGESSAAVDILRRCPVAHSAHERIYVHAAMQFNVLELPRDALERTDAALRSGADTVAIHHLRGQALQFLGKNEEAALAYESVLRLAPAHGPSHWALAQLSLSHGGSLRIARLRRLLDQTAPQSEEAAYLGYALFRELDRFGDTDGAWRALEAAAATRRRHVSYNADEERANFLAVASATADFKLSKGMASEHAHVPIFIVGMPRTGTTLLERVLGNHKDVAVCGELLDFRLQFQWAVDRNWVGALDHATGESMAAVDAALLGSRYLQKTAWRHQPSAFHTDKSQDNFHYCGLILKALPQARILHVRRNPMDSCFSNLKEIFEPKSYTYSYSFADVAAHFRNYRGLMDHWHRLAPGQILDVDYEDLVGAPEATASKVAAFCGLRPQEALSDVTRNQAPVTTASSVQVRQPIHRANVDGWKRYSRQLAPLAHLLGQ